MRKILILVVILNLIQVTFSQEQRGVTKGIDIKENSYIRIKSKAKNALRLGDIFIALKCYEKMQEIKPNNISDKLKLAELYEATRDYTNAEKYYQIVVDTDRKTYGYEVFKLAQIQKANSNWKSALTNFYWVESNLSVINRPEIKKLVKVEIQGCKDALAYKDSMKVAIVKHLDTSINNPHIEYSPIYLDDSTIIYGSLKEKEVKTYDRLLLKQDSIEAPKRKLFLARQKGDEWHHIGGFEGFEYNEDYEIGNIALNQSKTLLFFTLCKKNMLNKTICDIYYSEKSGDSYQEPKEVKNVNLPNYTSTQPTVGRESKKERDVLYFVSDRPGTKGGYDIWYSIYDPKRKSFKKPKNSGKDINTAGTEYTPYYDLSTRTLYFSSDGFPGIGQLDVFSTVGETKSWDEKVTNIGQPINSPADDIYFTLEKEGAEGFVVSNRLGGNGFLNPTCCDDIYSFKLTKHIDVWYVGKAIDQETGECLKDYDLKIYIVDSTTKEKYLSKIEYFDDCSYRVSVKPGYEYEVVAEKEGYLRNGNTFNTYGIEETDTVYADIPLEKIKEEPLVIEGILYPFNDYKLTEESKAVLDTTLLPLLLENKDLKIELSSHTDSKGSDKYNENLSQKRANSVIKYLVEKGINPNQLVAKGYGESRPIAPNENEDGSDNPDGRALNRRTEFQIIGKLTPEEMLWEEGDEVEVKLLDGKKEKKPSVGTKKRKISL